MPNLMVSAHDDLCDLINNTHRALVEVSLTDGDPFEMAEVVGQVNDKVFRWQQICAEAARNN